MKRLLIIILCFYVKIVGTQTTFTLQSSCGGCASQCVTQGICSPEETGSCNTSQTISSQVFLIPNGEFYRIILNEVAIGTCHNSGGSIDNTDNIFISINGINGTDLGISTFDNFDSGCVQNQTGATISLQIIFQTDRRDEQINCSVGIYSDNVCSILPIKLKKFEAFYFQDQVNLSWSTHTEIDNNYFSLERATNTEAFEEITAIKGSGNSENLIHYNYVDNSPQLGLNYYRLKQIDYSGNYSYSPIVSVDTKLNQEFKLMSNLVEDLLILNSNHPVSDRTNFKIYNQSGKILHSGTIEKFSKEIRINVADIPKGIYFLSLETKSGPNNLRFLK